VTAAAAPVLDGALIATDSQSGTSLRGWRCERCHALAFGVRRICARCGSSKGHETRLSETGRLETWTRVAGRSEYVVGYGLFGDGEDEQVVRILGPIDLADEGVLAHGQAVKVRFKVGQVTSGERLHHYFVPDPEAGG
jgi:uncharacterized OB-fold protein